MKVVVTGATGLVGTRLVRELLARGDQVTVLTRDADRARKRLGDVTALVADLETPGPWTESFAGAEAVVHLAGELIAGKRWDARQKQIIRDSRVESTRTIVEAIAKLERRPRCLITASAIDYYPFAPDAEFDDDEVTEADAPSDSFLGRLCRDWEEQAQAAEALGVRVARMRLGLIIAPGPALEKLTGPFRFFVGGKIASGRQWMSWVHVDDVVAAFMAALDDDRYRGAFNVVAGSLRNRDFAATLGKAMHRPAWLRVPAFALRAAVGELAEYILHGRNVVAKRLDELGFVWRHRDLEDALGLALQSSANSA
jgi:uncharacterized protein (TIGR01777 family)